MMKILSLTPLFALAAATVLAAAPPQRVAITQAQIAAVITDAGMTTSADQVALLSDVVASGAMPRLQVELMQPWGEHRWKVRMSCTSSEECLPFFVAVRRDAPSSTQTAIAAAERSASVSTQNRPDTRSFTVHAGSTATLLLDGGHVHIRIAVVCLENGAPGQTIRVSSKDHRQTYAALVMDGAVLRASL